MPKARMAARMLPSNHSPYFAPDVDPAMHTGIKAEVAVLRNLLNGASQWVIEILGLNFDDQMIRSPDGPILRAL